MSHYPRIFASNFDPWIMPENPENTQSTRVNYLCKLRVSFRCNLTGMALIAAGTAWELKQLCNGLKDMEALYAQMEIKEDLDADTLRAVCHPSSLWSN